MLFPVAPAIRAVVIRPRPNLSLQRHHPCCRAATECDFDTYVHQLSVLLPPHLARDDRSRRAPTEPGWLPWVTDTPPTPGYARNVSMSATRVP